MLELESKMQDRILLDQDFRKELGLSSLLLFAHIYFSHYMTYDSADFHKLICAELQDDAENFVEILAFRGSAKSTFSNTVYPIWAIVSKRKHFPVIASDTSGQAKLHIFNIRNELEKNYLLNKDFGPFHGRDEWTSTSLIIKEYDARVSARSTGQTIRGLRYKQYRPDVFIADDIEDLDSVGTKESRDKTYRWFKAAISGLSDNSKKVLIGNLLHSDGVMMRIKKEIENGTRKGKLLEIPIINADGTIAWSGRFPDMKAIEEKKAEINDMRTWQREFLLRIVSEEGQIIKDDWIKYYNELPSGTPQALGTAIDLAISKKATADYTTMVSGELRDAGGKPKVFIYANPINDRLSFNETIETAKGVSKALGGGEGYTQLWVEKVAYQAAAIEEMQNNGLPVEGVTVSQDKRARLQTVSAYLQNGTVEFPVKGCEDLIIQLIGFGVEAHDDLVDAFVMLVQKLMAQWDTAPMIG